MTDPEVGAAEGLTSESRSALQDRSPSGNLLARSFTVGLVFVLLLYAATYLRYAIKAVNYPYGLDYAEGMVWQQALLTPGQQMYGDITHYPYIIFYYPPLYHLFVRGFSSLGIDMLSSGRLISLASTIVTCALLAAIAIRIISERVSRTACAIAGLVAFLMPLSFQAVQEWAVLMRVDMLAMALASAGIYVTIVAGRRTIFLCCAFILFVLGIYTKPTEIAAPVAAVMVVGFYCPRAALAPTLIGFLIGGMTLMAVELYTGGGFLVHILAYNLNPFSLRHLADLFYVQRFDLVAVLTAVAALCLLWVEWMRSESLSRVRLLLQGLRKSEAMRASAMITLWAVFSCLMLATAGRIGASDNYFVECLCVVSILIGVLMALISDGALRVLPIRLPVGRYLSILCFPLALILSVLSQPNGENRLIFDSAGTAIRAQLVRRIQDSEKPVLSEDMVLLLRAGKEVPIEPFGFTQLSRQGVWDQTPFLRRLRESAFRFVITTRESKSVADQRFTPEMIEEIARNYPATETEGDFVIHSPP